MSIVDIHAKSHENQVVNMYNIHDQNGQTCRKKVTAFYILIHRLHMLQDTKGWVGWWGIWHAIYILWLHSFQGNVPGLQGCK